MAKKAKGKEAKSAGAAENSVAGQPRAAQSIARMRSRAALMGLVFGGVVAWQAQSDLFQIGLWSLISGIVFQLLGWWVGILLWQTAIPAEAKARHREALTEMQARLEERRRQNESS